MYPILFFVLLVVVFLPMVYIVYIVNPVPKDDSRTRKRVRNIFNLCMSFISCFLLANFWNSVNEPTRMKGILTEDISIYRNDQKFLCKLPKGIIVTDETPRGVNNIGIIGEPLSVFSITFDTNSKNFVDFSKPNKGNSYLSGYKQSNN